MRIQETVNESISQAAQGGYCSGYMAAIEDIAQGRLVGSYDELKERAALSDFHVYLWKSIRDLAAEANREAGNNEL